MGLYSDIYAGGNKSGVHYFDAAVLSVLVSTFGLEEVVSPEKASVEGPVVQLKDPTTKDVLVDDIVVGTNGQPSRDASKDTLILSIEVLAALSDAVQAVLRDYEQVPGGRREGVKTPVRT